jgi:hypothetical protein
MLRVARCALGTVLLTALVATYAGAQGSLRDRVTYEINVPSAMEIGYYELPAGRYVLYQINAVDPNRFALYRNDLRDTPIALLHPARVEVPEKRQGNGVALSIEFDETDSSATPLLRGWVIPGDGGYEIIRVDAPKGGLLRPDER